MPEWIYSGQALLLLPLRHPVLPALLQRVSPDLPESGDKEKYKCNNNNQCGDRTHNTLQYIFWHIVSPTFMLILQVQSHGSLPAFLFVRNRRPLLMEGRRGLFHILVSVCRYSAAILAFLIPMLPSPNRYTPVMLLLVAQMFLSLAMQSSGRSFHTISCTSP